jgi:hypothetical protein
MAGRRKVERIGHRAGGLETGQRRLGRRQIGTRTSMEFFRISKDIPFMRHALVFNVISLLTFLLAVTFLFTRGLHLSVEFTGGTLIELHYTQTADLEKNPRRARQSGLYRPLGTALRVQPGRLGPPASEGRSEHGQHRSVGHRSARR